MFLLQNWQKNAIIAYMDEKKKKILKILAYVLLSVLALTVIALCIVNAVYKDKTKDFQKKNEQFKSSQSVVTNMNLSDFTLED